MSTSQETWSQDDPRLQPLPLSSYKWTALPEPPTPEAIIKISIIPSSVLTAPANMFTPAAKEGQKTDVPCWSFLLEKGDWAALLDLGLRSDVENSTKHIQEIMKTSFSVKPGPGPVQQLKQGGFDIARLKAIFLSHQHFDRYDLGAILTPSGNLDALPSPPPPIILGPESLESIGPGHPHDPNSDWPATWLEKYQFVELPSADQSGAWTGDVAEVGASGAPSERRWQPVGCFERGVDWFGDGSMWLIDAPGHCPGHVMLLARVTAEPPTYVLIGGDASHHKDLYLPVPVSPEDDKRLPIPVVDGEPQLATDPPLATFTIGQLTRMSAESNVMVLLSHEPLDGSGIEFWPKNLEGWRGAGWKASKERV